MDLYEDLAWAGLVLWDVLYFDSTAFRDENEGFLELRVRGRHTGGFLLWNLSDYGGIYVEYRG